MTTDFIPVIYEFGQEFHKTFRENEGYGVIYTYTLPDGSQYVGQSKRIYIRHQQHSRKGACPVDYKIAQYGILPRIIWMGPLDRLDEMEVYFIKELNTLHPDGWNFSTGGQNRDHTHFVDAVRKARFKPVLCYDINTGDIVGEYESVNAAAEATGVMFTSVSACANGRTVYAGHYVFRFKTGDDYDRHIDLGYVADYIEDYMRKRNAQVSALRPTPEQYARMGEKQRGKFVSQETRDKISKARLGKPSSLKGRKLTEEQKQRRKELIAERHPDLYERQGKARSGTKATRAKSIYQRARNGAILARFETIKDAVEATGIDQSAISTCLTGKVKTAGGYIWTLTEDSAEKFGLTVDVPKLMKILQIDENGDIVNEFATSRDAYALTGIKDSSIRRAISNGTTAGGYKWMKVVEE